MKLKRILIVDDDADYAMLVEDTIRQTYPDVDLEKATTGAQALAKNLAQFDFIILDQNLPDTKGSDLLAEVLKRADRPVMMLTGEDNVPLAVHSLRSGAVDFMQKTDRIAAVLPLVIERAMREWDRKKESERLRQQLVQSEKMSAVGLLAAGVAHEINNPVGFVMSNLTTLTDYVAVFKKVLALYDQLVAAVLSGDVSTQQRTTTLLKEIIEQEDLAYVLNDVDHLLAESIEGTDRVKGIVQSLKSFARADETQPREADLNQGIEETLKVVWNELKYKCQIHKNLGNIPPVRCNLGQLNQVFMNLLMNAAHAIPEHGDISIETSADDQWVEVRISDNGVGIPPENLGKIFDPFFTTKEVGKGTGLGLSISHGIVRDHHGIIDVTSEVGKGTTFTVRLPRERPDDD